MALNAVDQEFLDTMVPHHQMALLMCRRVLAGGSDPELRELVANMLEDQTKEIKQMQALGAKPGKGDKAKFIPGLAKMPKEAEMKAYEQTKERLARGTV